MVSLLAALVLLADANLPGAAQGSPPGSVAAQPAPATYADAVQVLAREQSAAEQYAVILDRFGKNDIDLIQGRDPSASPKLAEQLRAAAEKRVAFTSFVADKVVGSTEGARGALPDVISLVPDLVKALTDAGLSIWREYATAGKERRAAIRDELDHLKWKPFADIAKT